MKNASEYRDPDFFESRKRREQLHILRDHEEQWYESHQGI